MAPAAPVPLRLAPRDPAASSGSALRSSFRLGSAQPQTFPPLTGRVVDAANILKPEDRAALEAKAQGA